MPAECQRIRPLTSPITPADGEFALWTLRLGQYDEGMSRKRKRVAALTGCFGEKGLDPHYTAFFELFNAEKFYEAHDVLEHIWLPDRHGPNGAFYKGLIQLAGAFVHLQKNRLRPAAALFKLAKTHLEKYPPVHDYLNLEAVRALIDRWLGGLERNEFQVNPLTAASAPKLNLEEPDA